MEIARNHLRGYWEPPTLSVFFAFIALGRLPPRQNDLVALFGTYRTIPSMKKDDLLEYPEITPEIDVFIERYSPQDQYSGQWERHRPRILDLVRKAAPTTIEKTSSFFWALGCLLAEAASSHFEGPLDELLTDEGIKRTVALLNSKRFSFNSIRIARTTLTTLHRVLHDLPSVISDEPRIRKASKPVSLDEITKILEYLKEPSEAMHLHIPRRFIMALGAGLIDEKADKARIFFGDRGISSIIDGSGVRRPLSKKWIALLGTLLTPDLELYKFPQAKATSRWLHEKSLPHLWSRLRDEWLLEQLDGNEPAFVQFRRAGVTDYDLDRMVLKWNQIPIADANNLLRNSQKYLSVECARLTTEHCLHQDLSQEV